LLVPAGDFPPVSRFGFRRASRFGFRRASRFGFRRSIGLCRYFGNQSSALARNSLKMLG
jgi:hypothetical protein